MIDRSTIQRIMDAADIVEVVREFVTLRKAGVNYKGLCPFKNEKTPGQFVNKMTNILVKMTDICSTAKTLASGTGFAYNDK